MEDETKYETSFRTFDAGDYSQIATIETKKSVLNLCSSLDDCHLAVIEQVRTGSFSFLSWPIFYIALQWIIMLQN